MDQYPAGHDDRSVAVASYKERWELTMPDGTAVECDAAGTPWDARIHTGNRSKHDTRELSICAGWRVMECADAGDFNWGELNYDYYIAEAEKLVTPLQPVTPGG